MTAYITSRDSITDRDAMATYLAAAPESVRPYGGEYLVRSGDIRVLEGEADYERVCLVLLTNKSISSSM